MKQTYKFLILLILIGLGSGCVTKKKKSDTSYLGRVYHNTTARYNGYFNANELVEETIFQLEEQYEDDYNELLPLYEYAAVGNVQSISENMDEAIKKVTVVVSLHPQSHWVDDCYLLAGKAEYIKQDYEAAEEMLRYMVNEFNPALASFGETKERASSGKVAANKSKAASKKARAKLRKQKVKERKKRKNEAKKRTKARKKYRKKLAKARKKGKPAPPKPPILVAYEEGNEDKTPEEIKKEMEEKAKQEAEDSQPDNYFLQHRPCYQEGVLWLARTLIERGNYESALRYLMELESSSKTFDDIREQIPVIKAYLYIKQERYNDALAPMQKAVALAQKRSVRGRYSFILGQLYQYEQQAANAYIAFEEAHRLSPDYVMQFNARLNMATNNWSSGQGSSDQAIAEINRMIRDERNLEYQDRLYYSMAQIALEENDKEGAISNFRKSLNVSQGNAKQKAEAYLALAGLYMADEEYLQASYHYDSTLMVLPKTDERYEEVQVLSENLSEVARNIEVIALQDSLLRIAALSPEEQKELATQIKKKEDQEKLNAIVAQANNANPNVRSISPTAGRNALQKESSFFAYDDKALKRGQREFQRKWGSRSLEDNWRRSSDQAQFQQAAEITEAIEETAAVNLTDEEVASILREVPSTETEKLSAQLKIQEALFNLGKLYREKLENHDKAIEALEGLLEQYPGTSFSLDAWYYLYLAYQQKNQPARAQEYADLIVKNYPASNYAKVIQDPNYLNELKSEEMLLNAFYDRAFANFSAGNYQEAYQMATAESARQFGNQNALQAKFALLAALCTGNLKGKEAYVSSLQEVVVKYPDSEEQTKAREILRLLGIRGNGLPGRATADEGDNRNYKIEENALHYMLVVFNTDVRLSDVTSEVSDYNRKYYQLEKYRYSQMFLGRTTQDGIPVLVIRRFKDKAEGMKYYDAIMNNRDEFIRSVTDFDIFLVSQNNYREILRSKSLAGYKDFFEQNYLQ